MTLKEKRRVFRKIRNRFKNGQALLLDSMRTWGIVTSDDALELMGEFIDSEYKAGAIWVVEMRPYECEAIDSITGKLCKEVVTAFWGRFRGKFDRKGTLAALEAMMEEIGNGNNV